MIDETLLTQIEECVFAVYGKVRLTETDTDPILALTLQDKKNRGHQVRMAMLDGPGSCTFDVPATASELRRGLAFYSGLV